MSKRNTEALVRRCFCDFCFSVSDNCFAGHCYLKNKFARAARRFVRLENAEKARPITMGDIIRRNNRRINRYQKLRAENAELRAKLATMQEILERALRNKKGE